MSGRIGLTPERMEDISRSYVAEAENVDGVIKNMDALLNSLQTEWEGAASQAYAQRYSELRPGFERAKDLIMEISVALTQTAQRLVETDEAIASRLRG